MQKLKCNAKGQILLLTGVFMALTLLTIAMTAVSISNLGKEASTLRARTIEREYINIKDTFGIALMKNKAIEGSLYKAFDKTVEQYKRLELRYGYCFNAERVKLEADKLYVKLVLIDDKTRLEEVVAYDIT